MGLPLALLTVGAAPFKQPVVDQPAPPFELTLIDGTKVDLAGLRGQVVVINFWATWCVPCKRELPLLDTYYRLQKKNGLRVFAVTTETSLPLRNLKPVFAAMTIESARRIKGPYGPIGNAVPSNFVIDRAGRVRYAKAGSFDLDDLNRILIPLLNEPAPTS
ncbi:TlpA disulfide reductase family protein [Sphingomonas sp. ST-64]|uniref:TlpA disulfide reductase family protein n=2 Tax=Sphingomonas plantiphila TaxID=3163295 RepID=A0ABW8YSU2_9SPHN